MATSSSYRTKVIISTIVALVFLFLLDYLFYGYLMVDFFSYCCQREMPDFAAIVVGILIFSFMFSFLYPGGLGGKTKTQQGLLYGFVVAMLVFIPMNFVSYAVYDPAQCDGFLQYAVDMLFRIVQITLLGAVVGNVHNAVYLKSRGKDEKEKMPPPKTDDTSDTDGRN